MLRVQNGGYGAAIKHEVKVTLKLIQVYVTNKKGDLQRYKVSGPASVPNHRP